MSSRTSERASDKMTHLSQIPLFARRRIRANLALVALPKPRQKPQRKRRADTSAGSQSRTSGAGEEAAKVGKLAGVSAIAASVRATFAHSERAGRRASERASEREALPASERSAPRNLWAESRPAQLGREVGAWSAP